MASFFARARASAALLAPLLPKPPKPPPEPFPEPWPNPFWFPSDPVFPGLLSLPSVTYIFFSGGSSLLILSLIQFPFVCMAIG
ncbi:hypothetical protein PSPTOT1_5379 [Pseudomonas syringae pv. tomato T1]|nr:hypothetical protein PSPTOT1_5379 [Pseudomonas syringae pv. tomato T1]